MSTAKIFFYYYLLHLTYIIESIILHILENYINQKQSRLER